MKYHEKRGDLDKSKKGVDLDDLRDTIVRKKEEMKRLRVQEDKLRDEKSVLDEHQEVLSVLNSKKKDAEDRQARIDKIQSKCRREIDRVDALRSVSEDKVRMRSRQDTAYRSAVTSREKIIRYNTYKRRPCTVQCYVTPYQIGSYPLNCYFLLKMFLVHSPNFELLIPPSSGRRSSAWPWRRCSRR